MSKKDIILVKIETEKVDYIPFGILHLASALKKNNFNVHVMHLQESEIYKLKNKAISLKETLLFVGFSCITGPPITSSLTASKNIHRLGINVVWGGQHATLFPELCLKEECIDFAILNEGEKTIIELADAMSRSQEYSAIENLCYKEKGKIIIKEETRKALENIDEFPPTYEMVDCNKYLHNNFGGKRTASFIFSRGCIHNCAFCYTNKFYKNKWRAPSIQNVLGQIDYFKKEYDIDGIYFHDDNFFSDFEWAKEIIEKTDLPYAVPLRANYINEDLVEWIKKTKFKGTFIGAESGSQKILDKIHKNITVKDILRSVKLLDIPDADIMLCFVFGFPHESEKDKQKTIEIIRQVREINPQTTVITRIFAPYPGTPLWDEAIKLGFKNPENNEEWSRIDQESDCALPWEDSRKLKKLTRRVEKYASIYNNKKSNIWKYLKYIQKWRWEHQYFDLPIELYMITLKRTFKDVFKKIH